MSKVFADNLKMFRLREKMTQDDLANAAGVTRTTIANYELGRGEPKFDLLCVLADALNVTINDLVRPEKDSQMRLTDWEMDLVKAYRNAESELVRSIVMEILMSHQRG